jgi:hypothetical protein
MTALPERVVGRRSPDRANMMRLSFIKIMRQIKAQ